MKIWLKRISAISLIALLLCTAWQRLVPPSSEECSICRFIKSHAPCLLNLSTGEIGELALYEPHRTKVGELAEVQQGGTFGFFYAAGAKGTRTTNPWVLTIRVPIEGARIRKSHFCQKCRELLEGYNHGYVLLDLYDKTKPTIAYQCDEGFSCLYLARNLLVYTNIFVRINPLTLQIIAS